MLWDYVEINGAISEDAVIHIDSVYDNANEIHIIEIEFYIGETGKQSSKALAYSINPPRHIYIYTYTYMNTVTHCHIHEHTVTHKCIHYKYIYAIFGIHHETST